MHMTATELLQHIEEQHEQSLPYHQALQLMLIPIWTAGHLDHDRCPMCSQGFTLNFAETSPLIPPVSQQILRCLQSCEHERLAEQQIAESFQFLARMLLQSLLRPNDRGSKRAKMDSADQDQTDMGPRQLFQTLQLMGKSCAKRESPTFSKPRTRSSTTSTRSPREPNGRCLSRWVIFPFG